MASSEVYGWIPLADVILSRYFAPVSIKGIGIYIEMAYFVIDIVDMINGFFN